MTPSNLSYPSTGLGFIQISWWGLKSTVLIREKSWSETSKMSKSSSSKGGLLLLSCCKDTWRRLRKEGWLWLTPTTRVFPLFLNWWRNSFNWSVGSSCRWEYTGLGNWYRSTIWCLSEYIWQMSFIERPTDSNMRTGSGCKRWMCC